MAHRDALGIAVELKYNEINCFFNSDVGLVFFAQVLDMARSFQSVWQSHNCLVAVHFNDRSGVLGSDSEDGFKYLPRVLFELLVTQAHSTILLVEFENHHLDFISYAAEF